MVAKGKLLVSRRLYRILEFESGSYGECSKGEGCGEKMKKEANLDLVIRLRTGISVFMTDHEASCDVRCHYKQVTMKDRSGKGTEIVE